MPWDELYQTGGTESTLKALERAGYPVLPNPDLTRHSHDLVVPLPIDQPSRPMAGHVVRLKAPWSIIPAGGFVGLEGTLDEIAPGYRIANAKASWHCGTSPDRKNCISLGCGGPAAHLSLDISHLKPTGETYRLLVWDFADRPQAHTGVHFLITVPLWSWTPTDRNSDSHFIRETKPCELA